MSFKTPFIAVGIMLSALAPLQAAEFNVAQMQQQELSCMLCGLVDGLDGDMFVIDCDIQPVITHVACMQDWLEHGRLDCPGCGYEMSAEQLEALLHTLVGVEPIVQQDLFDDEQFARAILAEIEEESRAVMAQEQEDERIALELAGMVATDLAEHIAQEVVVQTEQPQNNQQQAAQNEDEQDECSICMDELDNGSAIAGLPCHHNFHHRCITDWLSNNPTCPLCRAEINQASQIVVREAVLVN